jgi:hypothetical protein
MAGIDEQLRMREMATAGNPQAAQQKYAQSKDLMDLLVAQKVSNDYASARNAMQAATQTSANPIIDQLDMSNAQVTKNDMMRSLMPGVAIKAGRDQQAMQRQAMGIPSQPAANIRMADGGIVGYQQGGGVKRFQEGLAVIGDDESRFDVTDNELSPEEAQELDKQRRFVAAQERATRLGEAAMNPQAVLARLGKDSKENASGILNALVNLPSTVTGSLYNLATQPNAATRLMQRGAEASGIAPFMRGAGAPALPTPDPAYGFFRGDAKPEPKDEAQAQTSGTPLGNRVPSKDARREQVADPFDVKGMVDRLVEPEFRMQGVLDAPQIKGPAKKKGMFDNVDIGRLQAFLAGGGGQTSTAGALGGGLRGLMGEDQRREALVSKEAIEAAKINSQRYGIEQDFNAAMAKIGAEDRRMLFDAQADILRERLGGDIAAARDALDDMENSAVYQNEFMRLSAEYEDQPEVLRARLAALTDELATTRQDIFRGVVSGEGAGAFEVELPTGD